MKESLILSDIDDISLDEEISKISSKYKDIFDSSDASQANGAKTFMSPESKKKKTIGDAAKAIQGLGGKEFLEKMSLKKAESHKMTDTGSLTVLTPVRASKKQKLGK